MKYLFSILFFSLSLLAYGQDKNNINFRINNVPLDSLHKFVIIMNKTEYFLDSIPNSINPNWIDKIEVLKNEAQKYLHGNKSGVVLIYPKKKYFKKFAQCLKQ